MKIQFFYSCLLIFICFPSNAYSVSLIEKLKNAEAYIKLSAEQKKELVPDNATIDHKGGYLSSQGKIKFRNFNCPGCTGSIMEWNIENCNTFKCSKCSTSFPGKDFPENIHWEYVNWKGKTIKVPCYKNSKNKVYCFRGPINSFKFRYINSRIEDLAAAFESSKDVKYLQGSRDIFYELAGKFGQWINYNNSGYQSFNKSNADQGLFPNGGPRVRFEFQLQNNLLNTYWKNHSHPLMQEKIKDKKITYHEYIKKYFFEAMIEWWMSYDEIEAVYENRGIPGKSIIHFGKVLNSPRAMHYASRIPVNSIRWYKCGYDGMSLQGSSYHGLWTHHVTQIALGVTGWQDPPGYIDPVDGKNFSKPLKMNDFFPSTPRNFDIHSAQLFLMMPNGGVPNIHDHDKPRPLDGDKVAVLDRTHRNHIIPDETYNRILPAFGQIMMGGGRKESQAQTMLQFSGPGTHTHRDCLMLGLYGAGRELFSAVGYHGKQSYDKSLVVVDGKNQSKGLSEKGNVEFYTPEFSGICAARVSADKIDYSGVKMQRYRRTLIHNSIDEKKQYTIDVFEVIGGSEHHYIINGSGTYKQKSSSNFKFASTHVKIPFWKDYFEFKKTALNKGFIDFRFTDKPDIGSRTHFSNLQKGEIFLGKIKVKEKYVADRPSLMIHRKGEKGLNSRFVTVHEIVNGKTGIKSVSTHTLDKDSIALEIDLNNRKDLYLISFNGSKAMKYKDFSANAVIALRAENGKQEDLWMVGGSKAASNKKVIVSDKPLINGKLINALSFSDGQGVNALDVQAPLPLGSKLSGEMVYLDFYDKSGNFTSCNSYKVKVIKTTNKQGVLRLILEHDPGIKLGKTELEEKFDPWRKASSVKFRYVNCISSVPRISLMSPGENDEHPLQYKFGTPFSENLKVKIETVPQKIPVMYSLDGSDPALSNKETQGELLIKKDCQLKLIPLNRGGITAPRVKKEFYFGMRKSLKAENLQSGICKTENNQKQIVPDLLYETMKPFSEHGKKFNLSGFLNVPKSGYYNFYTRMESDNILKIADIPLIYNRGTRSLADYNAAIYLQKGFHKISIEYNAYEAGHFSLEWEGPGILRQEIKKEFLFCEKINKQR